MSTHLQDASPEAVLRSAIENYGGNAALASQLGISRPAVAQWKVCPALRVLDVERLTGASRHALRPDLYPRD